MSTFVLIHGAGDGGWYCHLVEAELRTHGHEVGSVIGGHPHNVSCHTSVRSGVASNRTTPH